MAHLAPQLYLSPGSAILAALARGHALPWVRIVREASAPEARPSARAIAITMREPVSAGLVVIRKTMPSSKVAMVSSAVKRMGSWVRCSSDWGSEPAGASRASRSMARLRGSMSAARAILS